MEDDPIKAVVEWVFNQLMKTAWWTYFSGARIRKLKTRIGTLDLVILLVRKRGCLPIFLIFLTERRLFEAVLALWKDYDGEIANKI
ncbi:MAG: hypothetical protein N3B16_12295 [Candidatus Aminicenantes bacterium]|nr:hypothetical protein [Candidatus Aminicenantes bacterium]